MRFDRMRVQLESLVHAGRDPSGRRVLFTVEERRKVFGVPVAELNHKAGYPQRSSPEPILPSAEPASYTLLGTPEAKLPGDPNPWVLRRDTTLE
jgi:hypothetical protein